MSKRLRFIGVAVVLLAAGAGYWLWPRGGARPLMEMMPEGDGAVLYVDVDVLRKAGLVERFSGEEEAEYKAFVAATGFNYRTDLDGVLVRLGGEAMHVIAAGRFDVEKMERYVVAQGGRCVRGLCTMEATSAGKYVSWQKLGRGVMGMTVGRDVLGAAVLGGRHEVTEAPEGAIWLMAPGAMLKAGEGLPAGMSAMMGAMEGAEKAVFRVERAGAGFAVRLEARCGTAERAGLVVGRMKEKTEMLKKLLEREGKGAEKGELSGVLVGGRFWAEGARARGEWALGAEFVERLGR